MAALLIIVAAVAAVISALTYPVWPRCTVAVPLISTMIGTSAFALLFLGPKDYMLRILGSLTTILHPYALGGIGSLALIIGVGGIVGLFRRWLLSRGPTR